MLIFYDIFVLLLAQSWSPWCLLSKKVGHPFAKGAIILEERAGIELKEKHGADLADIFPTIYRLPSVTE